MILIPKILFAVAFIVFPYANFTNAEFGYFSHYEQSPTDGTIAFRQNESGELPDDLSRYAGVVAVADCSLIGDDAWIYLTDLRVPAEYGFVWLPVKVFDCSGDMETSSWMRKNNIIGELGYYLTMKTGLYKQGGIRGKITFKNPIASTPQNYCTYIKLQ